MTDTCELDNLDDEEEEFGPSLAMPSVYIVRASTHCPECRRRLHVYTLGCDAFHDAEDSRPVEAFHFLRLITTLPEEAAAFVQSLCPGYFHDRTHPDETPYFMNHCECGARLDDDYLHGDVGSAFMPDTPDGYWDMKLHLLPISEPIPVECSYTLGGGEELDFGPEGRW